LQNKYFFYSPTIILLDPSFSSKALLQTADQSEKLGDKKGECLLSKKSLKSFDSRLSFLM
jgi:hypothetical protein